MLSCANQTEFQDEIKCYVQNFLAYLGTFSESLYYLRSKDPSEVERVLVLAKPLVDFPLMKQKVPNLPTQNEIDDSQDVLMTQPIIAAPIGTEPTPKNSDVIDPQVPQPLPPLPPLQQSNVVPSQQPPLPENL